ncbi:hypothetical protein DFP72DRAFT_1040510 [Ephemerocybe angulata]|uniref:Uncharacterized protein n=1 Tax=Ephemerocybe angulata TaxID=980116 RepID=A0A8H6IDV2_9AGAR|nr:hypothetical protein DFP72DRAFT_1040510 [Tulosesus angulatus]
MLFLTKNVAIAAFLIAPTIAAPLAQLADETANSRRSDSMGDTLSPRENGKNRRVVIPLVAGGLGGPLAKYAAEKGIQAWDKKHAAQPVKTREYDELDAREWEVVRRARTLAANLMIRRALSESSWDELD